MDMEYVDTGVDGQGNQGGWPTCVVYATCGALHTILQEEASIATPDVDQFVLIVRSHNLKNANGDYIKDAGTSFPHLADTLNTMMSNGSLSFTVRYKGQSVDLKFKITYRVHNAQAAFVKAMANDVTNFRHGVVSATRGSTNGMHGRHCMQTWGTEGGAVMVNNSWGDYKRHILVPGDDYPHFSYGCTVRVTDVQYQAGPGEGWKKHPGWLHEGAQPTHVALSPDSGYVLLMDETQFSMRAGANGWKERSAFWSCWERLDELAREAREIKSVAFAPDGGYVILFGKNGFSMRPGTDGWKEGSAFWNCWEKLDELGRENRETKSVAFAPDGGYVVLRGKIGSTACPGTDGWKERSAFWKCWERLDELARENSEIKSVAFAPDGGYVILFGKNGFSMRPGTDGWKERSAFWKCWERLDEAGRENRETKSVAFAPDGGYVILFGNNGFSILPGTSIWEAGSAFLNIWQKLAR